MKQYAFSDAEFLSGRSADSIKSSDAADRVKGDVAGADAESARHQSVAQFMKDDATKKGGQQGHHEPNDRKPSLRAVFQQDVKRQ